MTSKYHQQAKARKKKRKTTKFPDLNKDGKITFADVLKGRLKKGRT